MLLLLDTAVDLNGILRAVHGRDEPGGISEEVAHLLERPLGGLGKHSPEEDGIGKVADLSERLAFRVAIVHIRSNSQ